MPVETRRARIVDWLLKVLEAANSQGLGVNEEKLIAECALGFYCGERLVKELLKQLKLTGRIKEEIGEIWLTKTLNKTGG